MAFEALEKARKQRISAKAETSRSTMDVHRKTSSDGRIAAAQSTTQGPDQHRVNGTPDDSNKQRSNEQQRRDSDSTAGGSGIECYRCHERGHLAKNCSVRRDVKCFNCKETGHYSKNCTKPRKVRDAEVKWVDSSLAKKAAKYVKNVKIGNVNINAVIDPAISDCIVKASVVLENDLKFIRAPYTLVGIGKPGGEVKSSGIIIESVTVDECTANEISFRAAPDDALPYDVIIGQNFTELSDVVYYKIDDRFELGNAKTFHFKHTRKFKSQTVKIKLLV